MPQPPSHYPRQVTSPERRARIEALIEALAADARPIRGNGVARRLLAPALAGAVLSIGFVAATLGFRADLPQAFATSMFWTKLGYTLALGVISLWALERLARPAIAAGERLRWLAAPVAALLVICAAQVQAEPGEDVRHLLMGATAAVCPMRIMMFSIPPFLALTWAVRGLAPTHLRLTGALLGLCAGGLGAAAYALACGEAAALFLAAWYGLGILAVAAIGWVTGPAVLRW